MKKVPLKRRMASFYPIYVASGELKSGNQFILGNVQYSRMNFFDISKWDHGRTNLVPDFCSDIICDVPATLLDKSLLLHSGHSLVSWVYISVVILTPNFSNFTYFKQLQIPDAQTKYYIILTTYTETPHYTTRKIAIWYIEFNHHLSTLQENSDYFWTRVYMILGCTVLDQTDQHHS